MFVLIKLYFVCRDNSKLCSCGGDRQVFYWDVSTGRVIRKFRGHDSEVYGFCNSSLLSVEFSYVLNGYQVATIVM